MIKSIDLKGYRKICINFLIVICAMIAASFLLVKLHFYLQWTNSYLDIFKNILLFAMIVAAFIHSNTMLKRKETLDAIPDFEGKLTLYKKYFTLRMRWHILICGISCVLYIVTNHAFFFFFAILELIMVLAAFPTKPFFIRELNDDTITFI